MHLELRHLRTVRAVHDQGGLGRAAEVLHITQSALSHQIKALEEQAGMELFVRRSKPMRLSAAGLRLLRLAEQVLPMVETAEAEFRDVEIGRAGRLHIALECHHCLGWLLPMLDQFRHAWPAVDVDIRSTSAPGSMVALTREDVDMVITSDPDQVAEVAFRPLFDYGLMLVVPAGHHLSTKGYAEPADLAMQTLISTGADRARMDVFTHFLTPAGIEPAALRKVEMIEVALMLVASGRGVVVMPDWAARDAAANPELTVVPLGAQCLLRRLYAATRTADLTQPYIAYILRLARTEPMRILRG